MGINVFKGLPLRAFKELPESFDGDRGVSMTDKVGYVPLGDRLATLLGAGKRLIAARQELYDFIGDVGEVDPDVIRLRSPGFDLADVSQLKRELAKRQERKAREVAMSKASKRKQDMSDETSSPNGKSDAAKPDRDGVT